ncbi:hypothetical protein ILUMI_19264 [Ignelater luminosus]|uniref:MD-2-related lipid-recognition domain-containing protein n=1 Tax=Ignelater luminosus TaxID=2038154 RepID=A0A8K0CIH2_IGNLU|nr:hypothetical protein ILUMI_19264 [Ignelater luminosus]
MNVFVLSIFIVTVLSQGLDLSKFHQHDYRLTVERAHVFHYDKEYMNYIKVIPFKCNRTNVALNGTLNFKINVGSELVIMIQFYKFASNEYRLFPTRFQDKFCKFFENNVVGVQRLLNCGNFVGCPLVSNTNITWCNYIPDDSRFPPLIPSGSYRLNLHALYSNNELFVLEVYAKITRPEVK